VRVVDGVACQSSGPFVRYPGDGLQHVGFVVVIIQIPQLADLAVVPDGTELKNTKRRSENSKQETLGNLHWR